MKPKPMQKKPFHGRLALNKRTVTNLGSNEQKNIRGGSSFGDVCLTCTPIPCQSLLRDSCMCGTADVRNTIETDQ